MHLMGTWCLFFNEGHFSQVSCPGYNETTEMRCSGVLEMKLWHDQHTKFTYQRELRHLGTYVLYGEASPKRVPFSAFRYMKGYEICHLDIT